MKIRVMHTVRSSYLGLYVRVKTNKLPRPLVEVVNVFVFP